MNILERIKNAIKKLISNEQEQGKVVNNITQNINTGVTYTDVEKIAENVFERKILKMEMKKEKKDWKDPFYCFFILGFEIKAAK